MFKSKETIKKERKLFIMGKRLEEFFPGYQVTSFNPGIALTRWEYTSNGKSIPVDRINISEMAAKCLISKKEPESVTREDYERRLKEKDMDGGFEF